MLLWSPCCSKPLYHVEDIEGSQVLDVLTRATIPVMKHHFQKQVGEEKVYWLTLLYCSPLLKEVRTGTQTGQEPGGRS